MLNARATQEKGGREGGKREELKNKTYRCIARSIAKVECATTLLNSFTHASNLRVSVGVSCPNKDVCCLNSCSRNFALFPALSFLAS